VLGRLSGGEERASFPLGVWSAREYCRERLALVGDAAHTVHPLAGQGANLGFLDAASLVQVLGTAVEHEEDAVGLRVLRRYERWRRSENALMLGLTDALNQLFGLRGLAPAAGRRLGMGLVGGRPMLRRRLVEHALGLSGDLPDLVRRAG
jgi:2-octaprenylphenol hydroxylase